MQIVPQVSLPPSFQQASAPATLEDAQAQAQRPDPSMTWGDAATVLSLLASLSTLLRS